MFVTDGEGSHFLRCWPWTKWMRGHAIVSLRNASARRMFCFIFCFYPRPPSGHFLINFSLLSGMSRSRSTKIINATNILRPSEQFQSSPRAVSEQLRLFNHQISSIKFKSAKAQFQKQFQIQFRTVLEQFQCNSRAASEHSNSQCGLETSNDPTQLEMNEFTNAVLTKRPKQMKATARLIEMTSQSTP